MHGMSLTKERHGSSVRIQDVLDSEIDRESETAETHRQTDIHTIRQTDKQTERQTERLSVTDVFFKREKKGKKGNLLALFIRLKNTRSDGETRTLLLR